MTPPGAPDGHPKPNAVNRLVQWGFGPPDAAAPRRLRMFAHAVRVAIAACIATFVSLRFGLDDTWFAVVAAIVAMQSTLYSSVRSAATSIISAVIGTGLGIVTARLGLPSEWGVAVAVVATIGLPSLLGYSRLGEQAALVAVVIVLMPSNGGSLIPYAMNRLSQSLIGVVVALVVQLTVFPPRAHKKLVRELASIYRDMGQIMERTAAGIGTASVDTEAVHAIAVDLEPRLDFVYSSWDEAMLEHGARSVLDPAWRAMTRRVWEHCSVLETDVADAGESSLLAAVEAEAKGLTVELGQAMTAVAGRLGKGGGEPFDPARLSAARDRLMAAVAAQSSKWTPPKTSETLQGLAVVNAMNVICDELLSLGRDLDPTLVVPGT